MIKIQQIHTVKERFWSSYFLRLFKVLFIWARHTKIKCKLLCNVPTVFPVIIRSQSWSNKFTLLDLIKLGSDSLRLIEVAVLNTSTWSLV